jgi:hypothetical protein
MPLEPANHLDADVRWNCRDLARAVIELARVLGWQVYSLTEPCPAPTANGRGSVVGPGSVLLLMHPDQDRVLLAQLTGIGRWSGRPPRSDFTPRRSHGRTAAAVPRVVETRVWGPSEFMDGDVAACLLGADEGVEQAA